MPLFDCELEERDETTLLDDELGTELLLGTLDGALLRDELLDELGAMLLEDTELELDCVVPPAYSLAKPNSHA